MGCNCGGGNKVILSVPQIVSKSIGQVPSIPTVSGHPFLGVTIMPQDQTNSPPIEQQGKFSSLLGAARDVLNGNLATEQKQAQRLSICAQCPSRVTVPIIGDKCNDCGCVLQLKVKTLNSFCPKRLW